MLYYCYIIVKSIFRFSPNTRQWVNMDIHLNMANLRAIDLIQDPDAYRSQTFGFMCTCICLFKIKR